MTYELIDVSPLPGALGAEISGVDMAQPLGNQLFQEVHDALLENQVIFFRDQDITPAQHVAFARQFGTLQVHPLVPHLDDHPEVLVLESKEDKRNAANAWHSDVTFSEEPPLGSILLARKVPERGDTMWADMYAAYEALSPAMKRYLEGMTALHQAAGAQFEKTYEKEDGRGGEAREGKKVIPPAEHPIIRTHPETGRKALFVNSIFTQRIRGVTRKESRAILDFLYDHIATPEFTCRFHWEENSVAFWDNRCTQHYAIADYGGAHRLMHRVTVNGDKPF
ncbi:MAG: taurine dioxygenase [Rhodospirillaceae bacterium]|nr:taurine dioxygenase [Rhodospirillaceae bacterium]MDD9915487.1 taurine dioxygenase [Rhodospirillaceae bacterium]